MSTAPTGDPPVRVAVASGGGGMGLGKELREPPSDGVSSLRFSKHSDRLLVSSWDKVSSSKAITRSDRSDRRLAGRARRRLLFVWEKKQTLAFGLVWFDLMIWSMGFWWGELCFWLRVCSPSRRRCGSTTRRPMCPGGCSCTRRPSWVAAFTTTPRGSVPAPTTPCGGDADLLPVPFDWFFIERFSWDNGCTLSSLLFCAVLNGIGAFCKLILHFADVHYDVKNRIWG